MHEKAQLTTQDLITLVLRFFFKTLALYLLFNQRFTTSQIIITALIILGTELYEIPALIIVLRKKVSRPVIYSTVNFVNLAILTSISLYLNLQPKLVSLFILLVIIVLSVRGGLISGIISGITGALLYFLVFDTTNDLFFYNTTIQVAIYISSGTLFGLLSQLLYNINQKQELIIEHKTHFKKAEALKSKFISSLTSEIRKPLFSLKGYAQALAKTEVNSRQFKEDIEKAAIRVEQLNKIANKLINTTSLASDRLEFELEIKPLKPTLKQLVEKYQHVANNYNLRFDYEINLPDGIKVRQDVEKLKKALDRILDTIFRYNRDGNFIGFFAEYSPEKTAQKDSRDQLEIEIVGDELEIPGIKTPTDFLKPLNEQRFKPLKSSNDRLTSLELLHSKKVIEAHDGKIKIEKINHQTHIIINLPVT